MGTPCSTTLAADSLGDYDLFAISTDAAKTTGSSPPALSFLYPPVLWPTAYAYASDEPPANSQNTLCQSEIPNQASVLNIPFNVPFDPLANSVEIPQDEESTATAQATYQAVKTATALGWNGISYLDNRSQFTRYYLAGVYPERMNGGSTWYTRPQLRFAQSFYISPALRGQFQPMNSTAATQMLMSANRDMRIVAGLTPVMSGISLFFNAPVLYRSWKEADSSWRGGLFFTATAGDMTATVLHTAGPVIKSQAVVAAVAGNTATAAQLGTTSHKFAVAANLMQMTTAAMIMVDQVVQYAQTGECNYGMLSFNLTKFTFGLTSFVRSVQALEDILKAANSDDIFKISMGAITSEKWLWLKGLAKMIMVLGLVTNIYLLADAIQNGDNYKITSAALGLASNICFLIGIPELAAGPLAPIGGAWCIAGYSLITLQMIIDNRLYLKHLFDQACAIGAEGWSDLLTEVSNYDEVKIAAEKPLHFLNLQRTKAGLPAMSPDALLAGLDAYGVNVPPVTDDIVGADQYYNFRVLRAFTAIENHYLRMIGNNNGQVSESDRVSILALVYEAYQALVASPKAQAALLVLLGPLILENQKFASAMAGSQVGQTLQKILDDHFYVHEFKVIFLGDDVGYFDYVAKTKLRTEAWDSAKSWMGEQVDTYFTDAWTVFQIQTWSDDYLVYWNRLQRERGFNADLNFTTMVAQMKIFGVDRFDQKYIGKQNERSVQIMYEAVSVLRQMVAETKAPSEDTRVAILGRIYNVWAEELRGNPEAQAALLVLLEPVILTSPRYKTAMAKYAWGKSMLAALKSEKVLAFKKQLGLESAPAMRLAYNGEMTLSFAPNDARFATLSSYGAKPPTTLDLGALQNLDTNPDSVSQNWQALYENPPAKPMPTLQDGELTQLMTSLERLPAL